jgi:Lrp/AsnC family transcriptional regulator, leucine-responsive regulatory protein
VDELDRDILRRLQQDGRQTNAALAEALALSPSATHERVRRLEREGQVRAYRADVEPGALGIGLQAFVTAQLSEHSREAIERFEQTVGDVPGVRSCYHVTGRFDYLLHIAVQDLEKLGRLIKTDIAAVPGVAKLETLLVLDVVKPDEGWPVQSENQDRRQP